MKPVCWWVGLCPLPIGYLTWWVPTLDPTNCCVELDLDKKMVIFKRIHTNEYSPELLLPLSLSQQWTAPSPPPPCPMPPSNLRLLRRPSNTSRQVWSSFLWGPCFFPGLWCAWDFVCIFQEWFVYPSPVELLSSNPTGHQNQIFCGFLLPLTGHSLPPAAPSIGSLMWGSELLILWENFCVIIVFQFVGCSHGMHGIWFYHDCTPPTILLWLTLCLWMHGIFLVGPTVFLLMVIQQLVVFWCCYKKRWAHVPLLHHLVSQSSLQWF